MAKKRKTGRKKRDKGKAETAFSHIEKKQQDGIVFDSKLELYAYNQLIAHGILFEYHSKPFTLLKGFNYPYPTIEQVGYNFKEKLDQKVLPITYQIDFNCPFLHWAIETKGIRTDSFNLKWKLFKHLLSERGIHCKLYMPSSEKEVDMVILDIKKNVYGSREQH